MRVGVLGGTGVAGRATVEALAAQGDEPVALSRSSGVDVTAYDGLPKAFAGLDALVDATSVATMRRSAAEEFFATAARNVTRAAAEAGVGHVVVISIVGIDRVPMGYYQGKLAQEAALSGATVPVSILRSTQFHDFPGQLLDRGRGPVALVPKWRVQPVSVDEVAAEAATLATGTPVPMTQIAGPREEWMADLARRVLAARGARRRVLELPLPGRAGRALAGGGNLPRGDVIRGTEDFDTWLARRAGPREL